MAAIPIYLEVGARRVFACGLDWPGWSRGARSEQQAIEALLASAPRYAKAMGTSARGFGRPRTASDLKIVERLKGDATTDFGAPGRPPKADARPLDTKETARQVKLLRAAWAAFDRTATATEGATLRTGPRGGGRDVTKMVAHVRDADGAYLNKLGGQAPKADNFAEQMQVLREAIVEMVKLRARGEPPPPSKRPRDPSKLWAPRTFIRRSAWHALDHTWEIEDRIEP